MEEGENLVAYFTDEVANNIPIFFLILGILTSSFGILAHFTIEDKTNTKNLIKEHITSFSGDNSDVSQEALNVNIIGYDNLNTSAMARRQSAKLNTSQGLDNSMNNYFRKDVSLRNSFMGSNNYAPVYNIAPGIMYDVKKDCLPNILQDISKSNSRNAS